MHQPAHSHGEFGGSLKSTSQGYCYPASSFDSMLHDTVTDGFAEYSIAAICNACDVGGLEPAATSCTRFHKCNAPIRRRIDFRKAKNQLISALGRHQAYAPSNLGGTSMRLLQQSCATSVMGSVRPVSRCLQNEITNHTQSFTAQQYKSDSCNLSSIMLTENVAIHDQFPQTFDTPRRFSRCPSFSRGVFTAHFVDRVTFASLMAWSFICRSGSRNRDRRRCLE